MAKENIKIDPLKTYTKEDLKRTKVHATYNALRIAQGNNPALFVPESDEVPALFYVLVRGEVEFHALSVDMNNFLMNKSLPEGKSEDISKNPEEVLPEVTE